MSRPCVHCLGRDGWHCDARGRPRVRGPTRQGHVPRWANGGMARRHAEDSLVTCRRMSHELGGAASDTGRSTSHARQSTPIARGLAGGSAEPEATANEYVDANEAATARTHCAQRMSM
eukprot:2960924-Pleurochrysis_carterae.AAC.1